ncbi:hypothetical protein [Bacillus solimangrovi]|nr:hypothetical protein [Bacillus solimangrovi]
MFEWIVISLFLVAITLLCVSFFKQDKISDLEKQLEQIQMTMIKENYQLKKKMKVLEEEFILHDEPLKTVSTTSEQPIATKNVTTMSDHEKISYLYESGLNYEQISSQLNLPYDQIKLILESMNKRGRYS